jgi:hypothetical protein
MTVVGKNPTLRGGPASRETPALSNKVITLPNVPASKKVAVKQGDTLWDVSKRILNDTPNSAQIARLEAALKLKNPAINCAERDFGNHLVPGDQLELPDGNWAAAKPKDRPTGQASAVAAAKAQMDANKVAADLQLEQRKQTLANNLQAVVAFANSDEAKRNGGLNPGQASLVKSLIGQALRVAPELITPEVRQVASKAAASVDHVA